MHLTRIIRLTLDIDLISSSADQSTLFDLPHICLDWCCKIFAADQTRFKFKNIPLGIHIVIRNIHAANS